MLLALLLAIAAPAEGNVVLKDFHFASGETLPELRIHYRTYGAKGLPAVLILHGTTGSGAQFTGDDFAGVLFGKGQLLDAEKHFIILPDGIGHGKSSKPSDGLHARFPHYGYDDMVAAEHALVLALGVKHLRLVMGTSMGGMHTWLWGEKYPELMDALMPLASAPVQIAGRNRIMRDMIMDSIRADPAWAEGDYKEEPVLGLRAALNVLLVMGSAPLRFQDQYPTRDAADAFYRDWMKQAAALVRRERHALRLRRLARLRSLAAPGRHPGAAHGGELGGRHHQPARAGDPRTRDQARAQGRVRARSRFHPDARARHAHLPGLLEGALAAPAPAPLSACR